LILDRKEPIEMIKTVEGAAVSDERLARLERDGLVKRSLTDDCPTST
jgi:hypothetical protein